MAKRKAPDFKTKEMASLIARIFKKESETYSAMDRFHKRFKGKWWNTSALKDTESKINANFIFSIIETVAPLLTDNRPIWTVRARQSFMQQHVEAFSVALEYLWDKLEMEDVFFRWVKDALLMKIGIVKAWFDPDSDDVTVENVDPRTFFVAPGYDRLWNAPFCGVRMRKPMSWIRVTYPDKFKEVKADEDNVSSDQMSEMDDWELEEHFVTVYEVWLKDSSVEEYYVDIETNKRAEKKSERTETRERKQFPKGRLVTFTKDVVLNDKPSPYEHGKPPYVELYDYITPHEFFGMSEADQIEEINISFNRGLQLMHTWMTFYADPPWWVKSTANLNIEDFKQQLRAGGGVFEVNVAPGEEPFGKAAAPAPSPMVFNLMNAETNLMDNISGVQDVTRGEVGKSQRQSATEITTLLESSYTRMRQRVRNAESSLKRLLYLMVSSMQQFYSDLREFQISDEEGFQRFTVSNRNAFAAQAVSLGGTEDLSEDEETQRDSDVKRFMKEFGEVDPIYAPFDIQIETNSTLPMDKQSKANMFLRLLELAGSNPVTAMPMWKATLKTLGLPGHKKIISEMDQLFQQQSQAQQPPPAPQGPPQVSDILRSAG